MGLLARDPVPGLGLALKPLDALDDRIRTKRLDLPSAILKNGPKDHPINFLAMDWEVFHIPPHCRRQNRAPLELMDERRSHQLRALAADIRKPPIDTYPSGN